MCRPPFWEHFLFEFVATYLVRWSISRRPRVNPWLAIMESEQCFWKPIRDWHLARRNLQKLQVVEGQKAAAGSRGERMFSWGENFDSLAGGFLELGRRGSFEEEDEVADEQHGWTPKQLLSLVHFLFSIHCSIFYWFMSIALIVCRGRQGPRGCFDWVYLFIYDALLCLSHAFDFLFFWKWLDLLWTWFGFNLLYWRFPDQPHLY